MNKYQQILYNLPKHEQLFGFGKHLRYAKHMEFMRATKTHKHSLFMAGNRCGKSLAGAAVTYFNLTGKYPSWYEGVRYTLPIRAWAISPTYKTARDIIQETMDEFFQPEDIISRTRTANISGLYDTIQVRHASGGSSLLQLMSAEQKREKFQGVARHWLWVDEEVEMDIFTEAHMRTMTIPNSRVILTFTPLFGITDLIASFTKGGDDFVTGEVNQHQYITRCGWDDVPHISPAMIAEMTTGMPEHEIAARRHGVPTIGMGKVFNMSESEYTVAPFEVAGNFAILSGMDVGWNTNAMVELRKDDNTGVIYVTRELYLHQHSVDQFANQIHQFYHALGLPPIAIDPASGGASQADGRRIRDELQNHGIKTFPADNSVNAGLARLTGMLRSGDIKIFSSCVNLLNEMRTLRRNEKGNIVGTDHAIDAFRYACMHLEQFHYPNAVSGKNLVTSAPFA